MGRTPTTREKTRKRTKTRSSSKSRKTKTARSKASATPELESCFQCHADLTHAERALYVEEEVGRVFCSEECITRAFESEIARLEQDYLERVDSIAHEELSGEEREKLAHLRWMTLQEPDEAWREKTPEGDYRYTLISEFNPGNRRIWCVCITLCLRGEPSFLYLAFPTASARLVQLYRKGKKVDWEKRVREPLPAEEVAGEAVDAESEGPSDGLASAWSESETLRAQLNGERSADDISPDEFESYQACLEETLEKPDEVWSMNLKASSGGRDHVYHFIRRYKDRKPAHWYVVIAREVDSERPINAEGEAQLELLDAFPTVDAGLVERYRRGQQEVGEEAEAAAQAKGPRGSTRTVH